MDPLLVLIAITVAGSVGLIGFVAYQRLVLSRQAVVGRLTVPQAFSEAEAATPLRRPRRNIPLFNLLPISQAGEERMRRELELAGWPLRVGEYLTLRLASLVLGSVTALVLVRTLQPNAAFLRVLLVASLTIFGWLLPRLLMSRARKKRLERVERQLPDAVMALASSLRGGLGLLQALNVAASETPAPLGPQLQITLRELQLGAEAEETFGRLVQRLGSKDIDIVVTAILIQRAAGGNLSEILMNVANTVRERAEIRMEIMTLTSSQRLMGNLIAALPVLVAVAFVTLNPEVGKLLFETTVGQIALGVGIAFELLGLWVIRRLVKIEV